MTQNRSSAVMQQRHEALDALEDFPTPPWATRALYQHVLLPHVSFPGLPIALMSGWEPCCNRGHMLKVMREYGSPIVGSDVHDYGIGAWVCDFLIPGTEPAMVVLQGANLIVGNPPFVLALEFIQRARSIKENKITAMLVRTSFLEGSKRYRRLFAPNPPTFVAQFSERVVMLKGVLRDPDKRYWDGKQWRRPSTATSYCWLVWVDGMAPQPTVFIPPCRKVLTREGDYPVNPDEEGVFMPSQEGEQWLTEATPLTPTTMVGASDDSRNR